MASRVPDVALIGGGPVRRRADRGERRGIDDALDPGAECLLEHYLGATDIEGERLLARETEMRGARDVEYALDPAHRAADGAAVPDVCSDRLDVLGDRLRARVHGQA